MNFLLKFSVLISIVSIQLHYTSTLIHKTPTKNPTTNKSNCLSLDCSKNQICRNGLCECDSSHILDSKSHFFAHKECKIDGDCNGNDPKLICSCGKCICDQYYSINSDTGHCEKTVGMFCLDDNFCTENGDSKQICVEHRCQCQPNYNLIDDNPFCSLHKCINDFDCQLYDRNRICEDYFCKCKSKTKENSFKKCEEQDESTRYYWLLTMLLIIPFGVAIYMGKKWYKRNKNKKRDGDKKKNRRRFSFATTTFTI